VPYGTPLVYREKYRKARLEFNRSQGLMEHLKFHFQNKMPIGAILRQLQVHRKIALPILTSENGCCMFQLVGAVLKGVFNARY
jgi:hypothetical protein